MTSSRRTLPSPPHLPSRTELAFAIALAVRAGEILMEHYERLEQIDYKSARDVVTEADHLSEALILDAIRARFPDDALIAEETGEHRAIAGEAPTSGRGRVWIVDPLDGTINYANGIPFFCVSIALVVDGRPAVGVIHDPTRHETFAATVDGPATLDGHAVHASDKERLSGLRHLDGTQRSRRRDPSHRTSARRSASRATWARRRSRSPTSPTAASMRWSSRAACPRGTWPPPGSSPSAAGATVTSMTAARGSTSRIAPKSIGILAAPPAHHEALFQLVR